MQRTVPIPPQRLADEIPEGARVFVLGCGDCATRERYGGPVECAATAEALMAEGVTVIGHSAPAEGDGICDLRVARSAIQASAEALTQADTIVLLSCPQGIPAVERAGSLRVIAGTQIVVGGETGGGRATVEECQSCAQCIARAAGGLCPHAFCPKHLINGPCGGAQAGRCEVLPRRPCVWELIHRRLKLVGKLHILRSYQEPVSFAPRDAVEADGPR